MGIQWTLTKQLEDQDFADDISLLAHRHKEAQTKLHHVADEAEKVGLQININKTEVMRVNYNRQEAIHVQLQGKEIKESDSFTYLGSVVSKDGGTEEDIRNRINRARHAFNTLRPIWRATSLSLQNKIRIFGTNVKSVLLYGSETWRVTKTNTNKLQTFINKCLRNVLQIRWPEMIPNEELWERTGQEQIITEKKRRKWGWIGHTLRKPATKYTTRQALSWNPQGKRKVGRPRQTCRRSVEEELRQSELGGVSWGGPSKIGCDGGVLLRPYVPLGIKRHK